MSQHSLILEAPVNCVCLHPLCLPPPPPPAPQKQHTHTHQVLPVAFAARLDTSSPEVAAAWGLVWSEGAPSEGAALRAYGAEVLGVLLGGLGASAWGHKAAAAKVGG